MDGRLASTPARRLVITLGLAISLATGSVGAAVPGAQAAIVTTTVTASADARVVKGSPSSNYGTSTTLNVDGSPVEESFLRFDVSGTSGTVTQAVLRLYVTNGTVDGPAVYPAGGTWNEKGITWNNRPARLGPAVADVGKVGTNVTLSYDVTAAVTGNGSYTFDLATTSSDNMSARSREYSTASRRPQLVLTTSTSTGDTTPPDTTMTSGPTGTVTATDATFEFSSSESGSTFQCQLDNSAFAACTSPKTFTGLAGGSHTFAVRAVDAAGNADPTPATRTWMISGTPPPDTIRPTAPTSVSAAVDGPTQVTVRWTASTDDVGVVSYQVSRGSDVLADAVTGTSYVDKTVTPDSVYSYTVSAVDAAGNRSPESVPATVTTPATPPPSGSGAVSAGASISAGNTAAVTSVTVNRPAGVQDADVLIAQITADGNPNVNVAPPGWATVVSPRSVGTSARLFAYYRVVGDAVAEPSSYTWTLSTAVKWNAGITAFHGVDRATPFDTAAAVGANTSSTATSLSVTGVTTTVPGAMIVGGVGLNSAAAAVTEPSGWTEAFDATGAQVSELATQARPTAGTTGSAQWRFGTAVTSTGWLRALRPASGGAPPPPPTGTAPTASFTASPTSGTSPLAVRFTDTSTGAPTAWAWDFGDETRSTEQNPTHTFTAGTYRVTLTAANANGTSPPVSRSIDVVAPPTTTPRSHVAPTVETAPVAHSSDAADDAAIWVNAADPAASTVIGTDKQGALLVYDLAGRQLQSLLIGRANNVDVRAASGSGSGLSINGTPTSVVAVSNRTDNSIGLFAVDPATRLLRDVAARRISTGMAILGACMYRSATSGDVHVFVTSEGGLVQQWQLSATAAGTVDATLARSFEVGSMAEGCVADDATGAFYVAEENVGIWRYGAEPSAAASRTLVAPAAFGGPLVPTIEGLTIADTGAGGAGYLIASSQGDSTFAVYSRGGSNAYVGSFDLVAGNGIDGVDGTDGVDVVTTGLGPAFPSGVFVAQDGHNDGNQNFKLVPYQALAGLFG